MEDGMMKDHAQRREAIRAYKEQEDIGGIYRLCNNISGWKSEYRCTPNLKGQHSKMQFAKKTGLPFEPELAAQWEEYGPDAFEIQEIEQLKRQNEQTTAAFRKDLEALLELYTEGR